MRNSKKFIIPILTSSILICSSTLPLLVGCNQTIKTCILTFNASTGVISGSSSLRVEKGTTWKSIQNKPTVIVPQGSHSFTFWSVDGKNPINDDYAFNKDTQLTALYSQHIYDSYKIKDNKLLKMCSACGDTRQLTSEELSELNNRFFVEENSKIRLSDKTINEELVNVPVGGKLVIYLISTSKYAIELGQTSDTKTVEIHGLLDYDDHLITNIDCCKLKPDGTYTYYEDRGYNLSFINCKMIGRPSSKTGWYNGINCSGLVCKNCEFIGSQALYNDDAIGATFESCHFNSRDSRVPEDEDVDYAIYCYSGKAIFNNCNFDSWGRAVKIYSESSQLTGTFEFNDCNFNFTYDSKRLKKLDNLKAAIEVDSEIVNHYDVIIHHTTIQVNDKTTSEAPNGYAARSNDSASADKRHSTINDDGAKY